MLVRLSVPTASITVSYRLEFLQPFLSSWSNWDSDNAISPCRGYYIMSCRDTMSLQECEVILQDQYFLTDISTALRGLEFEGAR